MLICPSASDRLPVDFPRDLVNAALADLVLPEYGCSYGWDPTKRRNADATCAIMADKPPAEVTHADGSRLGNSPCHAFEGQNVLFNDGHVTWLSTPEPDAGADTDIFKGEPGYEFSRTDAMIIR